jgi:predicted transcriptional regulator
VKRPPVYSIGRWQRAIILAHLVRQSEGVTVGAIGDALGLDHTTLYNHLRQLDHMGLVDRLSHGAAGKAQPRFLYVATAAANMATGATHGL